MSTFNYFKSFTISDTSFPTTPQVNFEFNSTGFYLINRGSGVVYYSFDGETIHGDLNPSDSSIQIMFSARQENKIWFKASGSEVVRVEAWK